MNGQDAGPTGKAPTFRTAPWYTLATAPPRLLATPYWAYRYTSTMGVQRLKDLSVATWRRGGTAFILGSGPSINELTVSQWNAIRQGTSIGFNWWPKHEYVPDLYVFERLLEPHRKLLIDRAQDYRDVPLVLKQFIANFSPTIHRRRMAVMAKLPLDIRKRIYLSSDVLVPGRTQHELGRSYRVADRLGLFREKDRFQWVAKRTGSLTFLVSLCVRAGFKDIVLCGVDLNRPGTFYDSEPINTQIPMPHLTEDPAQKVIPISQVLRSLSDEVLKSRGISLYVAHPGSALATTMPVFDWPSAAAQELRKR